MGTNSCFEDFLVKVYIFSRVFPGFTTREVVLRFGAPFLSVYFGGFPGEYTVLEDLGPKEFGLLCFPGLCRAPNGP